MLTVTNICRGVGMADKLASDTSEEIHAGSSPVPCTNREPRLAIRVVEALIFYDFYLAFKVGYSSRTNGLSAVDIF